MASRMDRYRVGEGRSARNQDIYKQLEELGTYTNIEGVASIEGSNEIDISKIKEMLSNRENYQKQKRYKDLLNNEEKEEIVTKTVEEEEKNYDIKDKHIHQQLTEQMQYLSMSTLLYLHTHLRHTL